MHLSAEAVGFVPALALGYALVARAEPPGRFRVAAAVAGLALIFAAFATELQPLALHTFLWAHLLQNVVLAEWAPALLVLAIPPALGRRAARWWLLRPAFALPLWIVTYTVWHLPWAYDYALRQPHSLLHVEHAMYLVAGAALWWPVVHGRHNSGIKAAYLFAAFVLASPTGLTLAPRPAPVLLVLRARAAHLGSGAARRSADRRRDDGRRAGGRLLRDLHDVLSSASSGRNSEIRRYRPRTAPRGASAPPERRVEVDHGSVPSGVIEAVRRTGKWLRDARSQSDLGPAREVGDELQPTMLPHPFRHVADELRIVEPPEPLHLRGTRTASTDVPWPAFRGRPGRAVAADVVQVVTDHVDVAASPG